MPLNYKTKVTGKGNKFNQNEQPSPNNRQRALFACDPRDFDKYFDEITDEILIKQPNVAIYFYDTSDQVTRVIMEEELANVILFINPVTLNTNRDDCDLQKYIDFAHEKQIRILFIQCEQGIEDLFNKKYGNYQMLNKYDPDPTALCYDEKLSKFLESAIIGDELAEQIRQAFDAYVFLSYRKKDRKYANELIRLIHSNDFCRDIAIWYDEYLVPGEDFNDAIAEAMEKSGLFTMLVTPNLVNEENYVHTVEFPEAKKSNKPIFPAEAEKTDKQKLAEMFDGLSNTVDIKSGNFSDELRKAIEKIALKENDKDPKHNYLIGLAYLNGIDVEFNREKAIELITSAAEDGLEEAMQKMYDIATDYSNQNNYLEGIKIAEKLRIIYGNPEDKYLKEEKARLLELLGYLYKDNRDFEEAETALAEVIDIYNCLSKTKKEAHARAVLANLYTDIAEYDKAEELYREALEILNNCADADGSAEVADICNCFALFYEYKNEVGCAERLFLKSLYIFRKLAETDIIEYEYDITKVCSNLANLYTNTGRPDEAEKMFFEALEIRRRLAETVSKSAYSQGVALICNNLAVLYDKINKTKKAEESYTEALNIYRDLAETINKAAYEPLVAEACRNLACFYDNTGRRNEAEKLFSEALEIRRRLAETISMSAYESVVADTCYDFGLLYLNANNKDNAIIMLEEALSIYTHINEEILRVADVCRRLAFLYGQNEAEKAADYLLSAINIYIGLSKQQEYKEEYEPYVALTCSDLGSLYMVTGKLVEGLKLMRTAFNIAAKYKDVNPKCREIYDALS